MNKREKEVAKWRGKKLMATAATAAAAANKANNGMIFLCFIFISFHIKVETMPLPRSRKKAGPKGAERSTKRSGIYDRGSETMDGCDGNLRYFYLVHDEKVNCSRAIGH